MLRIIESKSRKRAVDYYSSSLAHGDYYLEQAQFPSRWFGAAVERLGLEGAVTRDAFESLASNRHPCTGEKLTPRDGPHRRVGYDFNYHCPKGVSLAYALTGDVAIVEAFHDAVDQTMLDAQQLAHTLVRVGGEKGKRETGNLAWGRFTHFTSRPVEGIPDPHLHAHCFAFNMTWDGEEARWKACEFAFIVTAAPTLERRFHDRLVENLRAAGYPAELRGRYSELPLFSTETLERFSRRTTEIEATAKAKGVTDARQKAKMGARTRKPKNTALSPDELAAIWTSLVPEHEVHAVRAIPERRRTAGLEHEAEVVHSQDRDRIGLHAEPNHSTSTERLLDTAEAEQRASRGEGKHTDSSDESAQYSETSNGKNKAKARPTCRFATPSDALDWALKVVAARRRVLSPTAVIRTAYAECGGAFSQATLRAALQVRKELFWGRRDTDHPKVARAMGIGGERDVLDFCLQNRGRHRPVVWGDVGYLNTKLSPDEQRAVTHALHSTDGVSVVSGPGSVANGNFLAELANQAFHQNYGVLIVTAKQAIADQLAGFTGDPSLMRWMPPGIRDGVRAVTAISRLLPDTDVAIGFQKFLHLPASLVPTRSQGRLVIVDDAAALGVEGFGQLANRCRELGARMVVTGDAGSVPVFGSGNTIAMLTGVGELPEAVIGGRKERFTPTLRRGLESLDKRKSLRDLVEEGHIVDAKAEETRRRIADVYANMAARNVKRPRKSRTKLAVTAPTSEEREALTAAIRSSLLNRRVLGNRLSKGGTVRRLIPMDWTETQKQETARYFPGMLVRFNRAVARFKPGEQVTVLGLARLGGGVLVTRGKGIPAYLPLDKSDRFTVLKNSKLRVLPGERIRFLAGGFTRDRKHRIEAGQVYELKRVTTGGHLKLQNGWVVDKNYQWLEYGYTSTAGGLHGQQPDLLLASGVGEPLISKQKLQSLLGSARDVVYFTPDVKQLEREARRTIAQPLATELIRETQRQHEEKMRHSRAAEQERGL